MFTSINGRDVTSEELARVADRFEISPVGMPAGGWPHKLRLTLRVRRRTSGVARSCYYASIEQ